MSEDVVNYRELSQQLDHLRNEVVAEVRIVGTVMDRRFDRLDSRVSAVEVGLASHERSAMHDGTAAEFSRIGDVLDKLSDQLLGLGRLVAWGAGAGAVLFIIAQVALAALL